MLDKKLLFLCKENDMFLIPIVDYLRKSYGDLVEIIRVDGNKNPPELYEFLNKCDLAWFEWCSDWCVPITQGEKYCKIFIRLHSYEAFNMQPPPNIGGVVQNVNWNQVDELIVPNQNVLDIIGIIKSYIVQDYAMNNQHIPIDVIRPNIDRTKINIIPNSVNCEDIKIPNDKPRNKKIAWLGFINYKKNFELALHVFLELLKIDPEYELHIAGIFQDIRERIYYDWITKDIPKNNQPGAKIFEYGWVNPKDLNLWFQDKTYIFSTSLFESFHHGIAQAMAAGLIPLIHNWLGASNLYPEEFIWHNISDGLTKLKKYDALSEKSFRDKSYEVRKYIVERYSETTIMPIIKTLIDSHLYEKEFVNHIKNGAGLPNGDFDLITIREMLERRGRLK